MKERIDKLVTIFVNHKYSPHEDAGWHQPSQMEWCEDKAKNKKSGGRKPVTASFAGDCSGGPKRSPEDKAIMETTYLRNAHHDLPDALYLVEEVRQKGERYYAVLISKPWYQAVYKRDFTQRELAKMLGVTLDQYKQALKKSYQVAEGVLESMDRRDRIRRDVA